MNNNLLYINNNQLFNEIVLNKHVDINLQLLTIGSGKKIWWKCKKGHQWQTSIRKRCKENQGCPFCCGKKVCIDNCLYTTQNNLCKEWNYNKNLHLTPYSVTTHSNKKVWWKCNKNHEWKTSVEERVRGRGCPYCCGKKVCIDNSLITKNPILCQEWNYEKNENLTPNNFTQFSAKKVWWKCEKGHEWQAMISNRSSGTGCKKCNNPNVSKIEKKFFHFFKLVFPEAENSYYFYYNGKRIEIDIFIKSLNLGIECDGGYVHSKERVIKNDIFIQTDILLILERLLNMTKFFIFVNVFFAVNLDYLVVTL